MKDDMRKPLRGKPPRGIQGRGPGREQGCCIVTSRYPPYRTYGRRLPVTHVTSIGLDVHARSVSACAFDPFTGEVVQRSFGTGRRRDRRLDQGVPRSPRRSTKRADRFALCRQLRALGVDCAVGRGVEDAEARRGEEAQERQARARRSWPACSPRATVVEVWVPPAEAEAARDLSRAVDDAREDLQRARQRLSKFLLRRGHVFDETRRARPQARRLDARVLALVCLITSDLPDLITRSFREWSTKNFRVWAWARRPSPTGPNVVAATVATMGGREGNDRRGQDRRYQKAREGRGERRLDRPGHRGLRAHGEKYLRETDLSERPPRSAGRPSRPCSSPSRALVDSWLLEDRRCWYKQAPHREEGLRPARRGEGLRGLVLDRQEVREEEARGARRRARRPRGAGVPAARLGSRASARSTSGRPTSACAASSPAAHFLVVTFPHSNVGLAQVFWGETAECACQGLRDVFEFLGGVRCGPCSTTPTEVGRRVGAEMRTSALFRRFAAHYGLDYKLHQPLLGEREGLRGEQGRDAQAQPLRPGPAGLGREGLQRAAARDVPGALRTASRTTARGASESELFGDDRAALSPLPAAPFACVTWLTRRCDKQGSFRAGGASTATRRAPPTRRARVAVAMGAFGTSRSVGARRRGSSPSISASGATRRPTPPTPRCS